MTHPPQGPGQHPHDPGRHHGHVQPGHGLNGEPEAYDATFWDARYESRDAAWDAEPNPHMERVATPLSPGTALDIGCGEGSDAVWLANRGWQVTATDISQVALDRGQANDATGRVTWLQTDVLAWEPPPGAFDLVASHFMHFGLTDRTALFTRLARAVKPGGTLLVVAHDPSDLETTAKRWNMPDLFYTADEVAAVLDAAEWGAVVTETCPRTITDPQGQAITIHDTVLVATRRG